MLFAGLLGGGRAAAPVLWTVTVALLLVYASAAQALIITGKGNDPVSDHNWPAGSLAVANLKTRVGWYEGPPFGGGQHAFQYRGGMADLQAALDLFARINAPELVLVVHEGPAESPFLKDDKDPKSHARYDWSFTVWNPESFNHLYNNPTSVFSAQDPGGNFRRGAVEPPRLDVYVGGAGAGVPAGQGIDWKQVKVPANVKVSDERASAAGYRAGSGSVLRGSAFDLVTSKPVAGAKVTLARHGGKGYYDYVEVAAVVAGADGKFELTNVPAGYYRVVASADGYAARVLGFAEFKADTLKEFAVRLSPPATLAGTVVDTDGKPVAGVSVRADSVMGPDGRGYLLPAEASATTDARGAFALATLPRGHCQLHASATGYSMLDPLTVQAVPTPGGLTVRVAAAGTVKARVAKPGGGPLGQPYMVRLTPEGGDKVGSYGGSGDVAADGTMRFDNVPPGRYTVTFRPNPGPSVQGKDPNERAIEVKGGQTVEVNFEVK